MPEISLPFCKRKLVGSCLEAEYQRAARRAEKQIEAYQSSVPDGAGSER